jgi:hypothetical protein
VFGEQDWSYDGNTATVGLGFTQVERPWNPDPAYGGTLTSSVTSAGTSYSMLHDFHITHDGEYLGSFVARDQVRCRRFPCSINTKMVFVEGEGVFADGFGGHINNGGDLIEYEGSIVYKASIGGELCWEPEPAA